MLEVSNLTRFFRGPEGTVRALDGVSFGLAQGEFVAVRGPSGCGKTTLLLVCGGLLQPSGGQVTVAGENPYRLPPDKRSRLRAGTMGFVFQQFHLVPYLTVLENVLTPFLAQPGPGAADHARELILRFDLESRINHTPAELSTGERQRTALARAILNRPKLLLADEPT
ncbi:MAG: ATP-binding cassette domain-containing protein, partial [Planctomycetes bacterium]|nr:ATP-binding cassette domain-containing protein [Planctomycetota bacterium]